ncbi:Pre-mRNA-processing factor 39, partial [Bienertia sinuspersici]
MDFQESSRKKEEPEHDTLDSEIVAFDDAEISRVINDLLDPSTRAKALEKYISVGEYFYQRACDLDAKVHKFEQNIHRPYYHVKPLDDSQLHNWHRYLDLVEMEGDFDWAVKLYERCLISCAHYAEFWMRYVDYV